MSFNKYNIKNDAFSQLLIGISASATNLEIKAGEGVKFPNTNFIGTIVQYQTPNDPTSEIIKKEKVLITTRSNDTMNITRGFGGDTPTSFNADDFFYLNIVAEIIEDLQNETARIVATDIAGLNTNKLNKNNELRTGNGAWRVFYNNASGNETALTLGGDGTVLTSNGSASAPTFSTPTVSIGGLSTITSLNNADEFIVNQSGNKKITKQNLQNNIDNIGGQSAITTLATGDELLIKTSSGLRRITKTNLGRQLDEATESNRGVVLRASNAEATAGTNTTKFITPKQLKDAFIKNIAQGTYNDTTNGGGSVSITCGFRPKYIYFYFTTQFKKTGGDQAVINSCGYGSVLNSGTTFLNSSININRQNSSVYCINHDSGDGNGRVRYSISSFGDTTFTLNRDNQANGTTPSINNIIIWVATD